MRTSSRFGLLTLLLAAGALPAFSLPETPKITDATSEQVRTCKPLGQIVGESAMCSKTRAKRSALRQAEGLGATHIIWLEVKCVPFVGEKATARIFDCAPQIASLEDVYEDYLAADPDLDKRTIASQSPHVMSSGDLDGDAADLHARGYELVGYAGVSGARPQLALVREKAKSVGAEVVLLLSTAAGQDLEYQSMTTYHRGETGIAISSGYASGTAGNQSVSAVGLGSTFATSPGETQTQVVPYSQRRYDTQLLFWRKLKAGPLGLVLELIPVELREPLARNTGAYVTAVEDESPAFFANILRGDVIISINGTPVRTPRELEGAVERSTGSSLGLRILRGTAEIEVEVTR